MLVKIEMLMMFLVMVMKLVWHGDEGHCACKDLNYNVVDVVGH